VTPSQYRHDTATISADNRDSGGKGAPPAAARGALNVASERVDAAFAM
jgi:hypothetical protein